MRILITNDDGIHAHGIKVLEQIARDSEGTGKLIRDVADNEHDEAAFVAQEIDRAAVIGLDPAHARGGEENGLRAVVVHPAQHRALVGQIELAPSGGQHLTVFLRQAADQRAADHARQDHSCWTRLQRL